MAFQPAALELQGHDPRIHFHSEQEEEADFKPVRPVLADGLPANLETLLYFATLQREKEKGYTNNSAGVEHHWGGFLTKAFKRNQDSLEKTSISSSAAPEKRGEKSGSSEEATVGVSPGEWRAASSSMRTATWASVFYLITTDILGPYSTPTAFAQVGYGPGVACFVAFGVMAAYSGVILWWLFLKLDSEQFPMRSYGDLCERVYGRYFRHISNILQSLQLVFNVGLIILGNGQGLSQMAHFKLCFTVCNIVWTLAGMILGQIRTLQKFGWVANLSIWMNILVLIMTMGAVAHMAPNYTASSATPGPVQTLAINTQPFEPQLNGIMQIVFSYGGAMIFIEFLAEMRRPWDFWKALALSSVFIFVVYMFFGLFVYSYQGQFVINPANQGISAYGLQTATNAISLTAGLIAAALYGNIGVKVIYSNILEEFFRAPPLTSLKGKYLFAVSVVVYWSLAFAIGSAVPQFSNISALIAAVCIFQFSYTFPPFLALGYLVQYDALEADRPYDPANPRASRVDSWRDSSRWIRGLSKHFLLNLFNLIITLACLSCAILSSYSAIKSIITDFQSGSSATSFGCHSPVDN